MGIGIHSKGYTSVSQGFTDNLWLGTTKESETGEGMPEVVESHPSQSCLPDDPGEIVGQRARVNRLPIVIYYLLNDAPVSLFITTSLPLPGLSLIYLIIGWKNRGK